MSTLLAHLGQPAISRRDAAFAALGLLGVAIVHVIDGPGALEDVTYVGTLELALSAAAVVVALALIVNPVRDAWLLAAGLSGAALVLYAASRTVGLPGSTDDVGNWGEALGLVSIAIEASVVALALKALKRSS